MMFGQDNSSGIRIDPESSNAQLVMAVAEGVTPGNFSEVFRLSTLASLLATPLFIFNRNYLSFFTPTDLNAPVPDLPEVFYVSVDLSEAIVVGVIPQWTVVLYAILSSIIFFLCVTGISLASFIKGPRISSFPIIDFSSRVVTNRGESSVADELRKLSSGLDDDIQSELGDKSLFLERIETDPNNAALGFKFDG